MQTIATPAAWLWFAALIIGLLALDLGLHRQSREIGFREALTWSLGWIGLALLFNGFVYLKFGSKPALEFLAGYVVEKALSVDNIFVFVVLFQAFAVPRHMQHRVLFWGIIGALVMRGLFIAGGSALLARFHWILYLFGLFLLLTGIRLLVRRHAQPADPKANPLYRLFTRFVPTASHYSGDRFFVLADGRWLATPLFASLVAIEAVDVVFALDSIPAIFAITTDPFIVLTSNVFAIFGLRTMFFLLGGAVERFKHLSIGLALVLIFVGAKLIVSGVYQVPVTASLVVIITLLGSSILASVWTRRGRSAETA